MWIRPNFGIFAGRAQFFRPDVAKRLIDEGRAERLDRAPTDEELERERDRRPDLLMAEPVTKTRRRRQR